MLSRAIRKKIFCRTTYVALVLASFIYGMARTVLVVNQRNPASVITKETAKDKFVLPMAPPVIPEDLNFPNEDKDTDKIALPVAQQDEGDHHGCEKWFEDTFEKNLEVIRNYPTGYADKYLWKIGGNMSRPNIMTSFPVIATGASSGYFGLVQGLLKSIDDVLVPKYGEVKVIFYDLGLLPAQVDTLKKHCKCEHRKFPFEEFPDYLGKKLKACAWKPLIVQKLLMEYGWVWWADASVRFKPGDLDGALAYSRENSILCFTNGPSLSVAQHTSVATMEYLGEDSCKFRPFGEFEAGFCLYHFDSVTKVIVNKWAACALNSECMSPPGAKIGCSPLNKQDGQCHRFDQSVLSVLLRRLYHERNDYPLVDEPIRIHLIDRRNRVNYFPNQTRIEVKVS